MLTSEHYLAIYLYIAIYASINHVYIYISIYGSFLIWVPENEPLKQPLKQTSETHPLKQPLKQGHSWLKKLEKKPAVERNLKAIWAAKGVPSETSLKHP